MNSVEDLIVRLNERYSRAPVSHPLIGQQTLFCHDCGSFVMNSELHDAHHAIFTAMQEALLALKVEPIAVVPPLAEEVPPSTSTPTTRNIGKAKTTGPSS